MLPPTVGDIKQCCDPLVGLSVRSMTWLNNGAFNGYGDYGTLIRNPVLVSMAVRLQGRWPNAGAASEAFGSWLRGMPPSNCSRLEDIVSPRDILSASRPNRDSPILYVQQCDE